MAWGFAYGLVRLSFFCVYVCACRALPMVRLWLAWWLGFNAAPVVAHSGLGLLWWLFGALPVGLACIFWGLGLACQGLPVAFCFLALLQVRPKCQFLLCFYTVTISKIGTVQPKSLYKKPVLYEIYRGLIFPYRYPVQLSKKKIRLVFFKVFFKTKYFLGQVPVFFIRYKNVKKFFHANIFYLSFSDIFLLEKT